MKYEEDCFPKDKIRINEDSEISDCKIEPRSNFLLPTSSIANRSPPTGAPKAEAIPAAAPALMKFLRSLEFLNRWKKGRLKPRVLDCEQGRCRSVSLSLIRQMERLRELK